MSVAIAEPRQLSVDDVDFYNEHGYLRLKQVFDPQELSGAQRRTRPHHSVLRDPRQGLVRAVAQATDAERR